MEVLKAVAQRAATHGDVVNLCVGQPATPAPAPVRAAAHAALDADRLGYTEALGIRSLREAIARHYRQWYAVDVGPEQVVVTTGSSSAFTALFLAAFDVGDLVAVTRPGYPAYRNTLVALGCSVLELDCGPETRYQPTVAMLAALPTPPRGLVVASPANPTGTVIDAVELAAIARWCAAHDCLLISDEIYHGIVYAGAAASAWEFSRDAAVVGSFSKYFSMTGWRLGWLLAPAGLERPVELLLGNLNLCAPTLAQLGAVAAFSPESHAELSGHVERYARNREILLNRLPELGIRDFAPPDGAFYAYCDVSHLTEDSAQWCREVLATTGVALTPGIDFATSRRGSDQRLDGRLFIRISFAGTPEEMHEGIDRLRAFLANRCQIH